MVSQDETYTFDATNGVYSFPIATGAPTATVLISLGSFLGKDPARLLLVCRDNAVPADSIFTDWVQTTDRVIIIDEDEEEANRRLGLEERMRRWNRQT
jgi:hypothetical protein